MGAMIDRDLEEFAAKWTAVYADWENSREPYTRSETEQMNLILCIPWPSEHRAVRYIDHDLHPSVYNYDCENGAVIYNHSLGKELYNAAGIADRVLKMVALRRVGWKILAHGESVHMWTEGGNSVGFFGPIICSNISPKMRT